MKNYFDLILDSYPSESNTMYNFLSAVLELPSAYDEEDELIESMLYQAAFAYLCSDYFKAAIDMYEHQDFELFLEESGFDACKKEIKIHYISNLPEEQTGDDFEEDVWNLIKVYQTKLCQKMFSFFQTREKVVRVFGSIFHLDGGDYSPSGDAMWYGGLEDFFNQIERYAKQ